jgi:hypothetical protein
MFEKIYIHFLDSFLNLVLSCESVSNLQNLAHFDSIKDFVLASERAGGMGTFFIQFHVEMKGTMARDTYSRYFNESYPYGAQRSRPKEFQFVHICKVMRVF